MQNLQFTGQIFGQRLTLKQVSKPAARKLYEQGSTIYLQSSNFHPFGGVWSQVMQISKNDFNVFSPLSTQDSFDDRVNSYRYYNCSNEQGRYVHFYVAI